MALGDEGGQHVLVCRGRMPVHQHTGADEGIDQRVRHHRIAEAQGRIEDLAEGAQVHHPFRRQPLQRRKRVPGVAQLAVVVVFHHPRLPRFGPGQQRLAARHAQRHAERILMRWRDKRRACVAGQRDTGLDVDAFLVHRHAYDALARPDAFQDGRDAAIGRVLHPHGIGGPQQHLAGEEQPLLRARGDHHLAGVATHRARAAQVIGNGFAQRQRALRFAVAGRGGAAAGAQAVAQLAPGLVGRRRAGRHRYRERHLGQGLELVCDGRERLRRRRQAHASACRVAWHEGGRQRRYARAGAMLRGEHAFGHQLFERIHHGAARNAERLGQRPCGRQRFPGLQVAARHGVAHGLHQLPAERPGAAVKRANERDFGHLGGSWHGGWREQDEGSGGKAGEVVQRNGHKLALHSTPVRFENTSLPSSPKLSEPPCTYPPISSCPARRPCTG